MNGYTQVLKDALEAINAKETTLNDLSEEYKDLKTTNETLKATNKTLKATYKRLIDFLSSLGYDANEVSRFLKEGRPLSGLKKRKAGS